MPYSGSTHPAKFLHRHLGLILVLALHSGSAAAIVAVDRDFPELVARAEQIVVGTVVEIRDEDTQAGGPYTFVTLADLSVLKGEAGDTLTLRFFGGTSGDTVVRVSDMPRFGLGERTVLFIAGNGEVICPLVGIWQGRFRVDAEPGTGIETVADHAGRPLLGRVGRELRRAQGQRAAVPALTLDQLRQLVADEIARPTR